jgi:hypothetical protein
VFPARRRAASATAAFSSDFQHFAIVSSGHQG